jgi:hypothetical protein
MDKLFNALPRDLQWEVLTEFLGTHVVRYGKLMRKIVYTTTPDGSISRQTGNTYFPVVSGTRVRQRLSWLYDRHDNIQHYIRFYSDTPMKFCEDAISGETIYCYRKVIDDLPLWELQFTPVRDTATTLPPFVKNVYPSYPHTDKKRRIPLVR